MTYMRFLGIFLLFSAFTGFAESTEERVSQGILDVRLEQFDLYRRNLHQWDRSVRGFRRDHSFNLSSYYSSGSWKVSGLDGDQVYTDEIKSEIFYQEFRYTFHIPLYRGFGYYLGTSTGAMFYESSPDKGKGPFYSFGVPGMVAGLVMNLTPAVRILTGMDLHIHRLEDFKFRSADSIQGVSLTARTVSFHILAEVYLSLKWGLQLEAKSEVMGSASGGSSSQVSVNLSREDRFYGVGLVYHAI